jgi:hypothetical protein
VCEISRNVTVVEVGQNVHYTDSMGLVITDSTILKIDTAYLTVLERVLII